ncbi:hypothetical protein NG825_00765 [Xanthomonas sacchari]|nr:hypothetical protein NG825_00765 [Xanthomonas sacchari]
MRVAAVAQPGRFALFPAGQHRVMATQHLHVVGQRQRRVHQRAHRRQVFHRLVLLRSGLAQQARSGQRQGGSVGRRHHAGDWYSSRPAATKERTQRNNRDRAVPGEAVREAMAFIP